MLAMAAAIFAGCGGGGRVTTVEGYGERQLNGKRIALLVPNANDLVMNNSAAYAHSRGVATEGAREMLSTELRTGLVTTLSTVLDSNAVVSYRDQVVAGTIPLDAVENFTQGTPKTWDKLEDAAKQANLDFVLLIAPFSISNTASTTGRGDETVDAGYSLIDPIKRRVMTTGTVQFTVSDPRSVANTYERFAQELAKKLPFTNNAK